MSNHDAKTFFTVVRHGETQANIDGRLQGQTNTHLDELGIAQVDTAAEFLQDEPFDICYSSDLWRAMETAEHVLKYHPQTRLVPSPELREWHLGDWEGAKQVEIKAKFPELLRAFIYERENVCPPGGESREQFQERIWNFMNILAERHAGQHVLLVTHGGVMQRMLLLAIGGFASKTNRLPLSSNASVSRFTCYPATHEWQLVSWNCDGHLKKLPLHETLIY